MPFFISEIMSIHSSTLTLNLLSECAVMDLYLRYWEHVEWQKTGQNLF